MIPVQDYSEIASSLLLASLRVEVGEIVPRESKAGVTKKKLPFVLGVLDMQTVGSNQCLLKFEGFPNLSKSAAFIEVSLTGRRGRQPSVVEHVADLPQFRVDQCIERSIGLSANRYAEAMVIPARVGVEPTAGRPLVVGKKVAAQSEDRMYVHISELANPGPDAGYAIPRHWNFEATAR